MEKARYILFGRRELSEQFITQSTVKPNINSLFIRTALDDGYQVFVYDNKLDLLQELNYEQEN